GKSKEIFIPRENIWLITLKVWRRKERIKPIRKKWIRIQNYLFMSEKKLENDWSPEQIAGRLKEHPPASLQGSKISHLRFFLSDFILHF
ncbi:MAG: hypothetical protein V1732_03430, partial [Patescibacteria group bacterium]